MYYGDRDGTDVGSENVAVLKGHTGLVGHLIIVGDELISSSTDGTVRTWSLIDYVELRCIRAHEGAITALACDGTRILSGSSDGSVKMWNFEKGELIQELVTGMDAVWRGGFFGDKAVAVYSKQESSVMEVRDILDFVNSVEELQIKASWLMYGPQFWTLDG
jgi:F-box and WD-40 domain protein CDC4